MQTFDWIVVGNGLTGAALSYELARQGHAVLLLERSISPASATRYSYGGVPFWSGSSDLLRQLCREGRDRYQAISEETGVSPEFRELDLVLTVNPDQDPKRLAERYAAVEIPPVPISAQAAVELEPQLNPAAISGALTVRHGHVNPLLLVKAYNHGLQNLGGQIVITTVTGLVRIGDRITGVTTPTQAYAAGNVAIAAGGLTRELLKTAGVKMPVYFTHAEIVETPPLTTQFRALIMPADLTRSAIESEVTDDDSDDIWDEAGHEIRLPSLDAGFIQFLDGTVRIGQISRINTALEPVLDAEASEQKIRAGIAPLIPALAAVPGQWRACRVAFSQDGLPLAGAVPGVTGAYVFSGFTSPFALVPASAVHFAEAVTTGHSVLMSQLSPQRLMK
ncbi:MAG: NAD(P)/FAD-dependent oxidoreductase [Leptolyngbyaceae cyanobacterium]